jgi:hypothetical protein
VVTHGDVKVNGLTVSGPITGNASCAEQEFGILALGGKLKLKDDSVLDIHDVNPALELFELEVARDSAVAGALDPFEPRSQRQH